MDEYLLYRGKIMFVIYVDDGIVVDKDMNNIMKVIEELKAEGYYIEDKQSISDY